MITLEYLVGFIPVLFICMARPLGLMLFMPILSGHPVSSNLVKSSVGLVISLPIIAQYHTEFHYLHLSVFNTSILIIKEISIGLFMSFIAAVPFWAIEAAGFVLDTLRGASMGEVFNVILKTQTSVFGLFTSSIISVLFLSLGGMIIILHALYDSYVAIPVFPLKLNFSAAFLEILSVQLNLFFKLIMVFSLPAMLAMLLVDIVLGLINVSAKQINVFNLSLPLKSIVAIFFIILTAEFSIPYYLKYINATEHSVTDLFRSLK